jgi:hypothetical protein
MSDHPAAQQRHRPKPTAGGHQEPPPEQQLTEHMEALFNARGRTLTDEATAEAYTITLDGVLTMLEGALVHGTTGEQEYQVLSRMVQGMRAVPGWL